MHDLPSKRPDGKIPCDGLYQHQTVYYTSPVGLLRRTGVDLRHGIFYGERFSRQYEVPIRLVKPYVPGRNG